MLELLNKPPELSKEQLEIIEALNSPQEESNNKESFNSGGKLK